MGFEGMGRNAARWAAAVVGGVALTTACTPALNWREVRAEGDAVVALFPCKPDRLSRPMELGGAKVQVELLACVTDGSTWGLTSADVGDASRVGPALAQMRAARTANLSGSELAASAAAVPGMTAASDAVALRLAGRRPDGQPVSEESVLFAVGTRVFHAAVLGSDPGADAKSNFFSNLKVRR